jgi:hypothetical protein
LVGSVRWRKVPVGPVKVMAEPVEVAADVVPALAGGGLDDAYEQQREPAEHDVGADALFEPVVDRAQVEDLFHVPQPCSTSRSCF